MNAAPAEARSPGRFSRQVASTFTLQVAASGMGILTGVVTARGLGPEGKGFLALAFLVPGLLALVLGGGLGLANVFFAGSKKYSPGQLAGNSSLLGLAGAALGFGAAGILAAAGAVGVLLPGLDPALFWLGLLGLPLLLLAGHFRSILQGIQRLDAVNIAAAAQAALVLGLTWLAVGPLKQGIRGALLALLAGALVHLAWLAVLLLRERAGFAPRWDREVARSTLAFGARGYLGNLLQFFSYRLDLFLVNAFCGAAEVGIYTVSVRLAELLWFFPNAVGFVIFPRAAAARPGEMNALTPRVLRITLWLSLAGAALLALAGQPLIDLAFSAAFAPAYLPLVILLGGVVLLGGAKVLANDIAGRGFPHYNSITSAVGAGTTLALDLWWIPGSGARGAAWASSVAYAVVFVLTLLFYRKASRRGERGAR